MREHQNALREQLRSGPCLCAATYHQATDFPWKARACRRLPPVSVKPAADRYPAAPRATSPKKGQGESESKSGRAELQSKRRAGSIGRDGMLASPRRPLVKRARPITHHCQGGAATASGTGRNHWGRAPAGAWAQTGPTSHHNARRPTREEDEDEVEESARKGAPVGPHCAARRRRMARGDARGPQSLAQRPSEDIRPGQPGGPRRHAVQAAASSSARRASTASGSDAGAESSRKSAPRSAGSPAQPSLGMMMQPKARHVVVH